MKLIIPVLAVLLLAGCTPPPSAETTPSPSPTESVSATPTSTPTPTVTAVAAATRPTVDELILEPTGFAALRLGVNPASLDPELSIVGLEDLECGISAWRPIIDDRPRDFNSNLQAFEVGVDDAGIVRGIQVFSPKITTAAGIGPGSTRAELLAAYPGISIAVSSVRHDIYVVRSGAGQLQIAVARPDYSWDETERDHVNEMIAVGSDVAPYAPGFHPIGTSCI